MHHHPSVQLVNLTKTFHGSPILEHIDLTVHAGEFLTILGPSGCGKTTLLRLISGFETPDTGDILIHGKSVTHKSASQRHTNTVFQNYALFPHMSVFENVAFGLRCQNRPKKEIQTRVHDILQMVKLEELHDRKPNQLSGGQQQRVAIARAVVNKPLVLLLDEPLSALDYSLRKEMQIELKRLQRRLNITFILVTHDQEEALSISDRVAVMEKGAIAQIGTPREIYETPKTLSVARFIGEANIFECVVLALTENKIQVSISGKSFWINNKIQATLHDKINVLVRPEDVRVWETQEIEHPENYIPARVEEVIYKGSTVDLFIRTDHGERLSATEFFDEDDENLDYKIGERVWVEWIVGWEELLRND